VGRVDFAIAAGAQALGIVLIGVNDENVGVLIHG